MKGSVRLFRFTVVGTLNALLTAVFIWFFMEYLGWNYKEANVLSYLLAQTNSFLWCKYWIFPVDPEKSKHNTFQQILLFGLTVLIAYIGQLLFILFLIELLQFNEYLGQFLGLFVYGAITYLCNRYLTFR